MRILKNAQGGQITTFYREFGAGRVSHGPSSAARNDNVAGRTMVPRRYADVHFRIPCTARIHCAGGMTEDVASFELLLPYNSDQLVYDSRVYSGSSLQYPLKVFTS